MAKKKASSVKKKPLPQQEKSRGKQGPQSPDHDFGGLPDLDPKKFLGCG